MLSMTTDYVTSTGDPSPYLRRIADAGFTHVHWCHQWNTDFLYSINEVRQIGKWLREYGLELLDLHGSVGPEKHWASAHDYQRKAGIELVKNRLDMTARLGGGVVIMHSGLPDAVAPQPPAWDTLRRSLDTVVVHARKRGVRIAIENGDWALIPEILQAYPPDAIGLCYDSGHGNLVRDGLAKLDAVKDRLISVHLHDNDGTGDQHRLPFSGTVDWPRLATILARSSYTKCLSLESNMGKEPPSSEEDYLARAFAAAERLTRMVEAARK